jgi:hypothetical protein
MDDSFVGDTTEKKKTYWYALPRSLNVCSDTFCDTVNVSEYIMLNNRLERIWEENGHNLVKVLFQNFWLD